MGCVCVQWAISRLEDMTMAVQLRGHEPELVRTRTCEMCLVAKMSSDGPTNLIMCGY